MHKTTQYLPNGDFNRYYSLLPPAVNNSGASMLVIVQSVRLRGGGGEVFGIKEDRVLLMGNAQAVVSEPSSVKEYLNEFTGLIGDEEKELVENLINAQLNKLEEELNQE